MGSILQTTLNTRVLPTGNFRYVRSDYPGKLTDEEVRWLYQNDITSGGFVVDVPGYEQPMEMIMIKAA